MKGLGIELVSVYSSCIGRNYYDIRIGEIDEASQSYEGLIGTMDVFKSAG